MSTLAGLQYLQASPALAAWLGAGTLLTTGALVTAHQVSVHRARSRSPEAAAPLVAPGGQAHPGRRSWPLRSRRR